MFDPILGSFFSPQHTVIFYLLCPQIIRLLCQKARPSSDKDPQWKGVPGYKGTAYLGRPWTQGSHSWACSFPPHPSTYYWQWCPANENLLQTLYCPSTVLRIKSEFPTRARGTQGSAKLFSSFLHSLSVLLLFPFVRQPLRYLQIPQQCFKFLGMAGTADSVPKCPHSRNPRVLARWVPRTPPRGLSTSSSSP